MKIFPGQKALPLLLACLALAAAAGYFLRTPCARLILACESEIGRIQILKQKSSAGELLREGRIAMLSDTYQAVDLFQTLRRNYPESAEAKKARVILVEMVSNRDASPAVLQEIVYQQMLAKQGSHGPNLSGQGPGAWAGRAEACRELDELDASRDWPLRWQVIFDSAANDESSIATMAYLKDLLDAARFYRNEASVRALLLKAVRSPELKAVHGAIAHVLLQTAQDDKGPADALILAEELARDRPDGEAGLEAFRYACDRLERRKDGPAVLAFLEECRAMPGNGLVQVAARDRMAARALDRNDIETAVSLYCSEAGPQSVFSLSGPALREAVKRMVAAAGRPAVTEVFALQSLGKAAAERKLYGASRDVYAQAAAIFHPPELGAGHEAETPFTEPDAAQFWQAYLLWHQGDTRRGREAYESLLARYHQGWQAAQMMYDLAAQALPQFRFEEAVDWADKAGQVLPGSRAVLDLRNSCAETRAGDRQSAATVAQLQEAAKSATDPAAKAEALTRVAEAQFGRGRTDDGVSELRRIWQEFPASPLAPKTMFRAAETLDGIPDPARKAEAERILDALVLNYPTDEHSPEAFDLLKRLQGDDLPRQATGGTELSPSDAAKTAEAKIPGAAGEALTGERRRTHYESAAEALLREGWTDEALEVIGRDLQGQVTREKLKEFLRACKARSDRELPPARAGRILPWADTCAGLQTVARILSYRAVNPEGVEEVCRALREKAPLSRAAMLARLSDADQAIRKKDFPGAWNLLAGLSDSLVPPEIRARALEVAGDCFFAQGRFGDADGKYREAAEGYVYEREIAGRSFFELKTHPLSDGAPPEAREADGLCVKGYLLLAQGLEYEGTDCLNQALARLDLLPKDSEVSGLRTVDIHLLLAAGYWAQGDRAPAEGHGLAALRHLVRTTQPQRRAELLAFAEALCRKANGEAPAKPASTAEAAAHWTLEDAEVAVVRDAKCDEARRAYEQALRKLAPHDVKTVLTVCEGILRCLARERPQDGLETVLFHFRAWAARSLPDEYEGCVSLAVAKACYANHELSRASEEVAACRALGTDEEVLARAELLVGLIEFRSGRAGEAVRSFEGVLARNPPQREIGAQALFLIGVVDLVNGDLEKAKETFGLLVGKYPHVEDANEYADVLGRLKFGNFQAGDSAGRRGP